MSKSLSKKPAPRGRPRLDTEVQRRRNITLSDRLAEKAARIGEGSVSEGIRRALEATESTKEDQT